MKNWLTIGQFSKKIGVSARALRLYEKIGLIESHARGENGYRYYQEDQLHKARRLKEFKDLGFSLADIKGLLESDGDLDSEKLIVGMKSRLSFIEGQADLLREQKNQIENILSSLQKKTEPLKAQQRRAIMSFYGKVSILVTGCEGLDKTAIFIQQHYRNSHQDISILQWYEGFILPDEKPYILVVPERYLSSDEVLAINADVIVIKSLSTHSNEVERNYLRLFAEAGPHVTTVINADDRASVSFAGNLEVQKGRIFYFSKNRALESQIQHIGGVISDGEELDMYGFNLKPKVHLKLNRIMAYEEEIALLSSIAAVLTAGIDQDNLRIS
ncbi:MerR family transcriptional regulator [Bdellovibrio svalbardensis]|uniref:MerR family transcriptional regulator n=1 Tax=Bdellovibrio svalbardensis TaxID=2972972 RepID=A0ABT6DDK6_9BACT|nr:MerR family transcriptional regulator [Bdellovibrio svalbardensis]MDG0814920.1 MerR family transcriptional regulator [Bdellovibrio svalbardensis]